MEIDTAEAARFLAALSGDTLHTFQTFGEAARGSRSLNRILHGTLQRHAVALSGLNLKGAGVFVMVNRGDGMGRKADNVTAGRALFVDLDGAPLDPVLSGPIRPRIVVESSPGKWHCYWPIADLPLGRFTDAQKALALRFDGDPKVHDRNRVLRLPGFLHNKGTPYQTRLVECSDAPPLTWHEMVEAFGLQDRVRLPDTIHEGGRNDTLFKLALSAARKGVPEAEQLRKAHEVNTRRCRPPLTAAEVAQAVASAYRRPVQGVAAIPLAVLDSEPYKALDDACRTLLLLAYRKADQNNLFTLTHSEVQEWIPRKNTFQEVRKRLTASGLLALAIPPVKKQPRNGKKEKAGFYRLPIGAFSATYAHPLIGAFTATPELLQDGAIEAPDSCLDAGGPK